MIPTLSFISEYFFVYVWFIVTTFINVVAPMAGSVVVNPVTAYFTDPQRAIGIGALIFCCTGFHRVYLFRKEIFEEKRNIKMIQLLLPYSIVGAILGGTLIVFLNTRVLALLIVVVSIYFIIKTIFQLYEKNEHNKNKNIAHLGVLSVGILTGFLQGAGMPGGDLRNNYLRTILSEVSVRAVGTVVGIVNFFIAGSIILVHNHLSSKDLLFIVTIVPLLIPVQIYGKLFLDKMPDRNAKLLAISFSIIGIALLSYKYLL